MILVFDIQFTAEINAHKRPETDNESLQSNHSETCGDDIILNVYKSTDPNHLLSEAKPRKKKSVAFPDDLIAGKLHILKLHVSGQSSVSIRKFLS